MNLPLVSIIIPIYNVEKYLENCLFSVFNQTYENIEVILINDGSTDKSKSIVFEYIERFKDKCIYIEKENGGQSECRLIAFEKSSGDYLYFIDSDDILELNAIEKLYSIINEYNADFCCCRYRLIDEKGKTIKESNKYKNELLEGNELIIKNTFESNQIKHTLWCKFFRKSFLLNNGLKPVKQITLHDDCMFTLLCSIYSNKVSFTNSVLYNVIQRNDSISRKCSPKMVTVYNEIYQILKKELHKEGKWDISKRCYYNGYYNSTMYALVLAAIRSKTFNDYTQIYNVFITKNICDISVDNNKRKLLSKKLYYIYRISLKPRLFYLITNLLKFSFNH